MGQNTRTCDSVKTVLSMMSEDLDMCCVILGQPCHPPQPWSPSVFIYKIGCVSTGEDWGEDHSDITHAPAL